MRYVKFSILKYIFGIFGEGELLAKVNFYFTSTMQIINMWQFSLDNQYLDRLLTFFLGYKFKLDFRYGYYKNIISSV